MFSELVRPNFGSKNEIPLIMPRILQRDAVSNRDYGSYLHILQFQNIEIQLLKFGEDLF